TCALPISDERPWKRGCIFAAYPDAPSPSRPSGSPSGCETRLRVGAITCIGTLSWKTRNQTGVRLRPNAQFSMPQPFVTEVSPSRAIEGGRISLLGNFEPADSRADVRVDGRAARTVFASSNRLSFIVPSGISDGGPVSISLNDVAIPNAGIELGATIATGLDQVDNPFIDPAGNVYLTYSGTRGQQGPVSIFRVAPNGVRETYSSAIVNPTSMAMDADGRLYVSSRFEGAVYRLADDGSAEPYATDLGIACGLAFAPDGSLFVGDRSGTIFCVYRSGKATVFASLPSSVAAFHLALGVDGLYVAGPTLSPYDVIYQIGFD